MAITSGARPVCLGLALVLATGLVASCAAIVPKDLQVPRFYFKDYSLNVSTRHVQGEGDSAFEKAKVSYLQSLKNVGLLYSPNYVFVADPVLLLAKTEPLTLPEADLVEETVLVNGVETKQKVLRKPLYYVERATVTYQVTGFDIPPTTYELQIPVKSNEYQLSLPAISQVGPLMAAYARDPVAAGTVSGTATVTVDMRDLDPLASERTFKVTRSLPLVYSYTSSRPEDTQEEAPPVLSPAPTLAPSATPSPSPSPSPSPTPTPTPTPSATTIL
jgi:hypothetical protein